MPMRFVVTQVAIEPNREISWRVKVAIAAVVAIVAVVAVVALVAKETGVKN